MAEGPPNANGRRRRRYRLLYRLEAGLEGPMFLLAIAWLWLFILEVTTNPAPWRQAAMGAIWAAFILEFLLKLVVAPRKFAYIARNRIMVVALIIPAFRVLRMLRAICLLRSERIISTTRIARALATADRFRKGPRAEQGPAPPPDMHVALMAATCPGGDPSALERLAAQIAEDVRPRLEEATGLRWLFRVTAPVALESDAPRRPSDFLDEASLRMVTGPYDLTIVVTDAALISRKRRIVAGLVSPTCRIAVISTRKLVSAPRGKPQRPLDSEVVRWNAGALLLHLLGHIGGLGPAGRRGSPVMAPFRFEEGRRTLARFTQRECRLLARRGARLPERELHGGGLADSLVFHIAMIAQHPRDVLRPLMRNRAPLLALSLPAFAAATVAPAFLLMFNAQIWDVGLTMRGTVAALYAVISVVGAAFYLIWAQALYLPRREKRVLTEHLAVANGVIFLSILFACVGLFVMVTALMMVIELWIFPPDLMRTWPTLDLPEVTFGDKLRLAAFIATVGVTTGALAGGLESRTVIRHLALFEDES